jgi:hypothetical protein
MTTYTVSTTSADCYADNGGTLHTSDTVLMLAGMNVPSDADVRTWIPFVVNMPQGKKIISATLRWVATDTRIEDFNYSIYCEAADNASAPATAAALYAKSLTTGRAGIAVPDHTTGVEYSEDVTAAVQAVLNRAGWAYGNTLAIIVDDAGATGTQRREIAAFENVTYAEPKLDIVTTYVPKGSGII